MGFTSLNPSYALTPHPPVITALLLAKATLLPHHLPARAIADGEHRRATTMRIGGGEKILQGDS
jgi:hypothetical protein